MALSMSKLAMGVERALAVRQPPAVTRWNRLEGRPRTHDFDRALRAEVRDALWMISRQWQMGEFHGDDAGSPVKARMCVDTARIDRYQAAQGPAQPLDPGLPLEGMVERRAPPLRAGAQALSLDLRMAVGRRWLKRLGRAFLDGDLTADYQAAYLGRYPVPAPDPSSPGDALVCAHADGWQAVSLAAERAMDGIAFLDRVAAGTAAFDGVGADPADEAVLGRMAGELRGWFAALIWQPDAADAWLPPRLEYQFGCSAPAGPGDLVMRAEGYHQGTLDWYALERRPDQDGLGGAKKGRSEKKKEEIEEKWWKT